MHKHNNNGHKNMIWMMIPCLLLIIVALLGGEKLASSKYFWLILVGICVIPHLWMMLKGHKKHDNAETEKSSDATLEELNKKVEHKDKHGGCCH